MQAGALVDGIASERICQMLEMAFGFDREEVKTEKRRIADDGCMAVGDWRAQVIAHVQRHVVVQGGPVRMASMKRLSW